MATKRSAATRAIHDTLNTLRSIESDGINDNKEVSRKRHRHHQSHEKISAEEVGKTLGDYVSMLLVPKIRPELVVASVETKKHECVEGATDGADVESTSEQVKEKESIGEKDVVMKDVASEEKQQSEGEDTSDKPSAEDAEKVEEKQDDDDDFKKSPKDVGMDEEKEDDSGNTTTNKDDDGKDEEKDDDETKNRDADGEENQKKNHEDDKKEPSTSDVDMETKATTTKSKDTTITTRKFTSNISPDPISIQRIQQLQSQLATLQKDVEFIQQKRANFFEKTSHVVNMYEYGLNQVVKLNDLMDAPDNFLPDD